MRREWSAFIKNRQWDELEKVAKKDPDQILANTVAELLRGLDEKKDQRALKKVLYILRERGYEPEELEGEEPSASESRSNEVAVLVSADSHGVFSALYGVRDRTRYRWLEVHASEDSGPVGADSFETPDSDIDGLIKKYLERQPKFRRGTLVAPAALLSRVRSILHRETGKTPPALAFWRSKLEAAPDVPHPSLEIAPAEVTPEQRRAVLIEVEPALPWRLELGPAANLLFTTYQQEQESGETQKDEVRERYRQAMESVRGEQFDDDAVRDHAMRLRDLAWILRDSEPDTAATLVATAIDLEERKGGSDYAVAAMDKATVLMLEMLKRRREEAERPQV